MFENKKIFIKCIGEEVHYSRIIASYRNVGGYIDYHDDEFAEWCKIIGIDDERAINDMEEMANCGKMELEMRARLYLNHCYKNKSIKEMEES